MFSRRQLVVLWVGILVTIGALVFPPMQWPGPYHLCFFGYGWAINYRILYTELAMIALLTAGMIVSLADRKR